MTYNVFFSQIYDVLITVIILKLNKYSQIKTSKFLTFYYGKFVKHLGKQNMSFGRSISEKIKI